MSDDVAASFLVFGPSGSGLTTTLSAFREMGRPVFWGISLQSMATFLDSSLSASQGIVLSPDIDPSENTPSTVKDLFEGLKHQYGKQLQLLYLSTPTPVLVERYAAAEKSHPYETTTLLAAIESEQIIFQALKPLSNYHIDTSTLSAVEVRLKVAKLLNRAIPAPAMTVNLVSFGFKYGVPTDAEMVFDMRFLPNPFYDEVLRPQTGLDASVSDFVFAFPETQAFLTHWQAMMRDTLPMYQKQGKTRVTIAVGCTGGQHRSVAMLMAMARFLKQAFPDATVHVNHREQSHWPSIAVQSA